MKTKKILLITLLAVLIFPGCFLRTLHPLVTEKDALIVEGLEGRWESRSQRWTFIHDQSLIPEYIPSAEVDAEDETDDLFELEKKNGYIILYENLEDGKADTAMFIGTVGKFSGSYFLNLSLFTESWQELQEGETNDNNILGYHSFPAHTISKLSLENDNLKIEFFEDSWIERLIKNNRVRIKHEKVGDDILITASTRELQKFITKYGNDEDALDDPIKMGRIQ